MSERPCVTPDLLASLTEAVPSRLRKKLDRAPLVAEDWEWTAPSDSEDRWVVRHEDAVVQLSAESGLLRARGDLSCSCLLAPRCFHILAVVAALKIDEPSAGQTGEFSETMSAGESSGQATEPQAASQANAPTAPCAVEARAPSNTELNLDATTRTSLKGFRRALEDVLVGGARAAGALVQARLLRAVHTCRVRGLHRLSGAGLRIVESLRQFRSESAEFELSALARDLREALECTCRLAALEDGSALPRVLVGVARRHFEAVEHLRADALLAEPVLTRSGYAGVVCRFVDASGELLTVNDIRPGEASRVEHVWSAGVDFAGIAMSMKELARRGLQIQNATRSADGRLGGGDKARAVPGPGANWLESVFASRFDEPLELQVARAVVRDGVADRSADSRGGLVFLRGRSVLGPTGALLLELFRDGRATGERLSLRPASFEIARENLARLREAVGLELLAVARVVRERPGEVELLAIAEVPGLAVVGGGRREPGEESQNSAATSSAPVEFVLPESWRGRVNIGLDRLQGRHFRRVGEREDTPAASSKAKTFADAPSDIANPPRLDSDGLASLRRRLEAMVLGGRHSVPQGALRAFERDALLLERRRQVVAARVLRHLAECASRSEQDMLGQRFPAGDAALADAWLAGAVYEDRAATSVAAKAWLAAVR